MRPVQTRLSRLMVATAVVAVVLAGVRALGDEAPAAILLFLAFLPIPLLASFVIWLTRPLQDEEETDRSFRRRWMPKPGSDQGNWVLSVILLLFFLGVLACPLVLGAVVHLLGED